MSTVRRPRMVLHIDDDPDDRYLVRQAIKSIDASIILRECQDGKKAIDFLNQAKLFGDLPSLIILDLNMPVMTGYQTYQEIKKDETLSSIPIVVFTTSFDDNEFVNWRKENVTMITKPPTFADFRDSIKKILGFAKKNK